MNRTILLYCFFLLSFGLIAQPQADFVADTTEGCAPLQVNFTNLSTNANQYEWDFGDGNSSTIFNPSNLYLQPDTYSVKLIARSAAGIDSLIRQSYIIVHKVPQINYTFSDSIQCLKGDSISFVNLGDTANAYTWSFGDGNGSSDFEPVYTYQDTGIYQTTLFAESPYGCRSTFSLSQTIRVKNNPNVDFQLDTSLICKSGVAVNFTSLAASSLEHFWDFGDGNKDSSKRITQHIYQLEGIYDVSLRVVDSDGCTSVKEKKKAVQFHLPKSLSVFASSDTICSNQAVEFKVDSTWTNIQWYLGDGNSSGEYDFFYSYLKAGDYVPSIIAFDTVGCKQELTLDTIQLLQSPIADFEDTTSSYCLPFSINFQNKSVFAQNYLWKLGPFSSANENPTFSINQAGKYDLELIAFNESCRDTIQLDDYLNVENSYAEIMVSDSVGCAPHQLVFSLANADNFKSVKWYFGNGDSLEGKRARYTYDLGGKFSPYVITETRGGCLDTAYYTPKIQVEDAQSVFNQPDTIFVCRASFVDFEGSSIGGDFWQWSFGDGDSSNLANPTHLFDSAGIYKVDLLTKNTLGCYYRIEPYNIVVVSDPKAEFSLSRNNCPNFEMHFTANAPGASRFLWEFGDGTSDSAANPIHYYSGPGFYNVSLSVWYPNGCFAQQTKINAVQMLPCIGNDSLVGGAGGGYSGAFNDTLAPIIACAPFQLELNIPNDSLRNIWWDFGDGDTSTSFNPIHNYVNRGSYSLKMIVEDNKGQFDTIINHNYIQLSKPIANFDVDINNFCSNSLVIFNNKSQFADFYEWSLGSAASTNNIHPSAFYNNSTNELIKLKAIDSNGCYDQSIKNISIGSPNPYFDFDHEVCLGDTVIFASNVVNYDAYEWEIGNKTFYGDTLYYLSEDTGTFTVRLKAYDSTNCVSTFNSPKLLTISNPIANFIFNDTAIACDYYDLNVNNLSVGAEEFIWLLGNGDSVLGKNPNYRYRDSGVFNISLIASKDGCYNTSSSKTVEVNKAFADFDIVQSSYCLPIQVDFIDQSKKAIKWNWKFGDGDSSIQQNPRHTFQTKPDKQILTIVDSSGCESSISKNAIKTHQANPQADKWEGCVPLQIQFADSTKNISSFFWDFGDGNTSNQQFPVHTYSVPGTYDLTLITQSIEGCYDTVLIKNAVVAGSVIADFVSTADSNACAPHMSVFENKSKGAINYNWEFGDGKTSSKEQPIHVYHKAGVYDVRLIVDNGFNCADTIIKHKRFNINTPEISFSMNDSVFCGATEVKFEDLSQRVASRRWFFGDGSTSTERNTSHFYVDVKKYTVSLVVTDTAGCVENLSKVIRIKRKPVASFTLDSTYGCIPAKITFRNHSSELEEPVYTWLLNHQRFAAFDTNLIFNKQEAYNVGLIVKNANGCADTVLKENHLKIYDNELINNPVVKHVSRNEVGDWLIEWEKNEDFNFKFYQLYRKNGSGQFTPYIQLWDQNQTSYQIASRSNWESRQCFKIEVVKYCSERADLNDLETYCSIDLTATKVDDFIRLNWTPFPIQNRSHFEVHRRKANESNYKLISSVDTASFQWVDSSILCPEPYIYQIKLSSNDNTYSVFSNTVQIMPNDLLSDLDIEVRKVSVIDDQKVLLEWEPTYYANEIADKLYLSKRNSRGSFSIVNELPLNTTSYLDNNSQINSQALEYRLSLSNQCSNIYSIESKIKSLFLEIEQEDEEINLRWTKIEGLNNEVGYYLIQIQNNNGGWETIKKVSRNEFESVLEYKD